MNSSLKMTISCHSMPTRSLPVTISYCGDYHEELSLCLSSLVGNNVRIMSLIQLNHR